MKKELEDCPFCGSSDVGGSALLGTMHINCYKCKAETKFPITGMHINDQMRRWNRRENNSFVKESKKLMEALTDISNMCIGDLAMGHSMDAGSIGNMIYTATLRTNPELNEYMKEIESKQA